MRVESLIKILQKVDPKLEIFCTSNTGEYQYGLVNQARTMSIRLEEVEYKDEDEETEVFVISEE